MAKIVISRRAEKDLSTLPAHIRRRFYRAFAILEKDQLAVDIRPLEGAEGTWRLRIGEYRGIFQRTADGCWFTRIGHRSNVYRGL